MSEPILLHGATYRKTKGHKYIHCHPAQAKKLNVEQYLHRQLWVDNYGPIPEGYQIHHKNHNVLDNRIENLQCLSSTEHRQHHLNEQMGDPNSWRNSDACKEHLANIRELTKDWHSSKEGRAWHKEHGKQVMAKRKPINKTCELCGTEYKTLNLGNSKFCSNNCKSKFRRQSGVDNELRHCTVCSTTFTANKYSKAQTCSPKCSGKLTTKK
jgi:predicted nucleic acid-binding Zn ribbon protein